MILLSIIVPVYNVERWLHRCIDSILLQDLSADNYEVILVDDGSIDRSSRICDDYAAAHPKLVRVIHQQNKGLSGARNTGIEVSEGKYVMFVDSDDFIETNVIGKLIEQADAKNVDILYYDFNIVNQISDIHEYKQKRILGNDIISGEKYILKGGEVGSACKSIYLKELIERTKIVFIEGITHEDVAFNLQIIPYADRIAYFDSPVYYYWQEGESITRTSSVGKIQKNISSDVIVAFISKKKSEELSDNLSKEYIKITNSIVAGVVIQIVLKKHIWESGYVDRCFNNMIEKGLYPIKGRTKSWKTTLLIPFLNCRWLIKWIIRQ